MMNIMNWTNKFFIITSLTLLVAINEFTLVFLDSHPPLSISAISAIHMFDLSLVISAIAGDFLFKKIWGGAKTASNLLSSYVLPSIVTILLLDIFLGFIGFGYHHSQYEKANVERYPSPGDSFVGKPYVKDHNKHGFRGTFNSDGNSLSIALFGGSTGYAGNPTMIEVVRSKLEEKGISANIFNFSSVGSNHTQHLHRLLKFHDSFKFDIVIFFGGGNETLQYSISDPRIGYPYNFFFRNELGPVLQALLKYSSLAGEFDRITGSISGLGRLKTETKSAGWEERIIEKYWQDIGVAESITTSLIEPNICTRPIFLSVTQPGNPFTSEGKSLWAKLRKSQKVRSSEETHVDFTNYAREIEFTDIIHVTQDSRNFLGEKLGTLVYEIYSSRCIL